MCAASTGVSRGEAVSCGWVDRVDSQSFARQAGAGTCPHAVAGGPGSRGEARNPGLGCAGYIAMR